MKRFAPSLWVVSLVFLLGAAYLATLLPGIGYSGDTIKFQYLGHVLGISNAPGYPLYLMLNHLMSLLPFGSLAYKANLFSALCAVGACLALYGLLGRLGVGHLMALLAALTFGFSQALWSQAVVAEVYTPHIFLMALVLYTLVSWHLTRKTRYFYLATALYALSFGNHLLAITLLPAFVYIVWATDRSVFVQPKKIFWVVLVVALSASQYSYLFWRFNDLQNPFVETFNGKNFIYYVTGGPFKPLMFAFSPAEIVTERLALFFTFMYDNLKVVPLFAVAGGVLLWRSYRPIAIFLLVYYLSNAVYTLNYDIPDIWGYFIPNDLVMVTFAGFFGDRALRWARGRGRWEKGVPVLAALVPLLLFGLHYGRVDKSGSVDQKEGTEAALGAIGENAIVAAPDYGSGQGLLYYLFGEDWSKARNLYAVSYGFNRDHLHAYLEHDEPLYLFGRESPSKTGLPLYSYPCPISALTQSGFTVSEPWAGVPRLCRLEASKINLEVDDTELFQEGLFTKNLTPVKTAGKISWRWGLGPATELTFRLETPQPLAFHLHFSTPFDETITVEVNGEVTAITPVPNEPVERTLRFEGHVGENRIVLRYSAWNRRPEKLFPDERLPLAVRFETLSVEAVARADTLQPPVSR